MGEELETLAQPGPSGVSRTANRNKDQAGNKTSVTFDKVIDNDASSNNKKRYEESDNMPSSSKKRNYEELFGDISDLLETNVSGMIVTGKLHTYKSLIIFQIILEIYSFFSF